MITRREKLQAGPGSRELSDEFLLAMGWKAEIRAKTHHPRVTDTLWHPNDVLHGFWEGAQPNPTLDTDDALALVPDGWRIEYIQQNQDGSFELLLTDDLPSRTHNPQKVVKALTLPLAICVAALEINK
jgi:hypothetical protein